MKKFGLICLAVIMALGALGVGYAAWTDEILIDGTVETGSVDINPVYFSGMYILKDLISGDLIEQHYVIDKDGNLLWASELPPGVSPVAISVCFADPSVEDGVTVSFYYAFPYEYHVADVIIHCDGSVPVIVSADVVTADPMLEWLWNNGYIFYEAAWVDVTPDPWSCTVIGKIKCGDVVQMHYCDYIKIWFYLTLPQHDDQVMLDAGYTQEDFMNKNWSFTATIDAIQWNEAQ